MANNEEKRILVLEADKSNLNQFIFDLSWKHLDKAKGNEISRAEAVEIIKKRLDNIVPEFKGYARKSLADVNLRREIAEAALDALLGKGEGK